jgi:FkbM family methyltransferase
MPVTSYSQVGEDLQIAYLLGRQEEVSYVDVGCLWPVEHSNSYFFYERGGNGLCIDPNPTIAETYREQRPRDTFVNCGVGSTTGSLEYVMHQNPVFNTFSKERADRVQRQAAKRKGNGRNEIGTVSVDVRPLSQIIEDSKVLERTEGRIDFISIDVEGLELEVVQSIDFGRVRPRLIVTEHIHRGSADAEGDPLVSYLDGCGYTVVAYTGHDLFFMDAQAA